MEGRNDHVDLAAKQGAAENTNNDKDAKLTLKSDRGMIIDSAIEYWQVKWLYFTTEHNRKDA